MKRLAAVLVCLLSLSATAAAALEVPYLSSPIVDLAGLLPAETRSRLEQRLTRFASTRGSQVAVLTVPSLEGDALEDFSQRVATEWALGRSDADDGVLFLVAHGDRRMRIEVGYGLEGSLTDAHSRRILDWIVAPRFQQGDFGGGIEAGVEAILGQIDGTAPPLEPPSRDRNDGGIPFFVVLLLLIAFVLLIRRAQRSQGWSSDGGWIPPPTHWGGSRGRGGFTGGIGGGGFGGFGGGGFGGGGGGFGGGGASGGW